MRWRFNQLWKNAWVGVVLSTHRSLLVLVAVVAYGMVTRRWHMAASAAVALGAFITSGFLGGIVYALGQPLDGGGFLGRCLRSILATEAALALFMAELASWFVRSEPEPHGASYFRLMGTISQPLFWAFIAVLGLALGWWVARLTQEWDFKRRTAARR